MSALRKIRITVGMTLKQLGKAIGVTEPSVHRYENLDERLTLPLLRRLASALKCTIAQIAEETPYPDEHIGGPGDDIALIGLLATDAGAGTGRYSDSEDVIGRVAFQRSWLRQVTRAPEDQLRVIGIAGDSMEPGLRNGDHALIDLTQTMPRADGIYIIDYQGELMVKRLRIDPFRRTVTVSSDNPKYSPLQDLSADDLRVAGRVIWIGRRV